MSGRGKSTPRTPRTTSKDGRAKTAPANGKAKKKKVKKVKKKDLKKSRKRRDVGDETRLRALADPDRMMQLRHKFLDQCRKYFGVPYAKKYWTSDDKEFYSPIFLDCCGLVRRAMRDLKKDFGFRIGPWNQAYQYDTLPVTIKYEDVKPGDLVFISAIYYSEKKKKQRHNITHVEVMTGEGEQTIGSRWNKGHVGYFDSYRFKPQAYHSEVYIFKSLDTWLMGICRSHCPLHTWKTRAEKFKPSKKSVFNLLEEPSNNEQNVEADENASDSSDSETENVVRIARSEVEAAKKSVQDVTSKTDEDENEKDKDVTSKADDNSSACAKQSETTTRVFDAKTGEYVDVLEVLDTASSEDDDNDEEEDTDEDCDMYRPSTCDTGISYAYPPLRPSLSGLVAEGKGLGACSESDESNERSSPRSPYNYSRSPSFNRAAIKFGRESTQARISLNPVPKEELKNLLSVSKFKCQTRYGDQQQLQGKSPPASALPSSRNNSQTTAQAGQKQSSSTSSCDISSVLSSMVLTPSGSTDPSSNAQQIAKDSDDSGMGSDSKVNSALFDIRSSYSDKSEGLEEAKKVIEEVNQELQEDVEDENTNNSNNEDSTNEDTDRDQENWVNSELADENLNSNNVEASEAETTTEEVAMREESVESATNLKEEVVEKEEKKEGSISVEERIRAILEAKEERIREGWM